MPDTEISMLDCRKHLLLILCEHMKSPPRFLFQPTPVAPEQPPAAVFNVAEPIAPAAVELPEQPVVTAAPVPVQQQQIFVAQVWGPIMNDSYRVLKHSAARNSSILLKQASERAEIIQSTETQMLDV